MRVSPVPAAVLAVAAFALPSLAHAGAAPADEPRSPLVATALAAAPIGLSVALGIAAAETDSDALGFAATTGLLVGPSLGHFYAGEWGRGLFTAGARTAGIGLILLGAFAGWGECERGASYDDPCHAEGAEEAEDGRVVMGIGAGVFVAATVYDVVDAPFAARRFNERFTVAPTLVSGAAGDAPGLAISGRF
jgi:hypothetical protein